MKISMLPLRIMLFACAFVPVVPFVHTFKQTRLGPIMRDPVQRGGAANAFGGGQASMVFANQARGKLRTGQRW